MRQEIVPWRTIVVCKRCHWPWIPRRTDTMSCPHCGLRNWDSGERIDKAQGDINAMKREFLFKD